VNRLVKGSIAVLLVAGVGAPALPKKPVQSALPLIHAPAVKREGFAWDASREIE